jgi:hypothetical protein
MNENKMNDKPAVAVPATIADPAGTNQVPRVRLDRRALLRAGAGAAPVLLTLVSNPVAAADSCVVASSFVSVATFKSRNPTATVISCTSLKCEDWRARCDLSPMPTCLTPNVSTLLGATGSTYDGTPVYQVMKLGSAIATSGEIGVLQHILALHMCLTGGFMRTSAGNLSPAYLASMWQNFRSNGGQYLLSGSSISWDSTKLISWLRYQLAYSVPV